jgi:PAP2 superfamily protein
VQVRFAGRPGGPGTEVHRAGSATHGEPREEAALDPAAPGAAGTKVRRPPLVREIALVAGLFLVYRLGRLAITGHDQLAVTNAWWIWDVERTLRLPDEELFQQWALQWPDLLKAANWYYVGVHFPLTAIFLIWGWLKRPPAEYRYARRLLSLLTGLALVVHVVMPLAPPRMLSSLGFLDTMAVFGPSAYGDSTTATVANQFAAMPSLHVGWALLIAVVVVRTARTPWRWVAILHPTITVLVVVATANHYWVDAIAAALLLLLAIAVTPQPYAPSPVAAWWSGRRRARAVPAPAGRNLLAAPVGIPKPAAGGDDRAADTRLDADEETDPDRGRVFAGCPRPRPPVD